LFAAGSVFEHAVLLCDLFLGRGIDAFVCLGETTAGERHAWVVTLGLDAAGAAGARTAEVGAW